MKKITSLLWLLPIVISLHVFEEFGYPGGLMKWIRTNKPRKPRSNFWYIIENGLGILGAFYIALKADDILGFRIYLFVIDIMGWNALSHIRGTIQKRQYCPGVISGTLLTFPLMLLSNLYFVVTSRVNIFSVIVFTCVGILEGFYLAGMDIRRKDYSYSKSNQ